MRVRRPSDWDLGVDRPATRPGRGPRPRAKSLGFPARDTGRDAAAGNRSGASAKVSKAEAGGPEHWVRDPDLGPMAWGPAPGQWPATGRNGCMIEKSKAKQPPAAALADVMDQSNLQQPTSLGAFGRGPQGTRQSFPRASGHGGQISRFRGADPRGLIRSTGLELL